MQPEAELSKEFWWLIATSAGTGIMTMLGILVTLWKDSRNRKWQVEDRNAELAAIVQRAEAEALAQKIRAEAQLMAMKTETQLQTLQLARMNKETVQASNANREELKTLIVASTESLKKNDTTKE